MTPLEKLQAELVEVEKAVSAAYSGAEYEIQDGATKRRLKRADLTVLLKRKAELELSVGRLSGGGPSFGMPVDSPRGCIY